MSATRAKTQLLSKDIPSCQIKSTLELLMPGVTLPPFSKVSVWVVKCEETHRISQYGAQLFIRLPEDKRIVYKKSCLCVLKIKSHKDGLRTFTKDGQQIGHSVLSRNNPLYLKCRELFEDMEMTTTPTQQQVDELFAQFR